MYFENHNKIKKDLPFVMHTDIVGCNRYLSQLHWHDNLEILNCLDGEGTVIIDSKPISMTKGTTVIINSGSSHNIISDSSVTYHCIIIDYDFLTQVAGIPEQHNFIPSVCNEKLYNHLNNAMEEFNKKKHGYDIAVKAEILNALCVLYRISPNSIQKSDNTYIKDAIRYIKNNFNRDISLEDIANSASLSKYYFTRLFKSYTNCTVNEYIRSVRCREAEYLLSHSNLSVSEIATQCGFNDISYFTKVFKEETGLLPSEIKTKKNPQ
ncbi:MAG: helix-turn-helix transcriptional regulator [Clostridia bacterium]|nr:helix-turn-helix transcriptional regulator [Clostridia bacterium]